MRRRFLEFFAGGGMARAGLEAAGWRCVFANDFDSKKAASYQRNWSDGSDLLAVSDIADVSAADLPSADLAWASFPCQDLSLAGSGAGLNGERSGTFHTFWNLIDMLDDRSRPDFVVLENVVGALSSNGGKDFSMIGSRLAASGYRFGAVVVDAALFVPQSRPRLFIIGVRARIEIDGELMGDTPSDLFHPARLRKAVESFDAETLRHWVWWNLPTPQERVSVLADVIEQDPPDVQWNSAEKTGALLAMMSDVNAAKVEAAKRAGRPIVGGVYKRTRRESGVRVQRAEVRFDGVAGCLRTPSGGSSRQTILVVDSDDVKSRLISARETARLMGLSDDYELPKKYNDAYHLTGDGVAVPVVTFLMDSLINRICAADDAARMVVAA